jgi:hypothetical protein
MPAYIYPLFASRPDAYSQAFNLALSIHTQAGKRARARPSCSAVGHACGAETMTSNADNALKAKNTALSKSLRAKAHTLWLQERQALDEVSKDRQMVKQEEAAVERVASEAATLAARMDKRLAAVNAEVRAGRCSLISVQRV